MFYYILYLKVIDKEKREEGSKMIDKIRNILLKNKVRLIPGMTEKGISYAEEFYDITFPKNYKEMLMNFVPVSNGFYNWNDYSKENVNLIKNMLELPYEDIIFDIRENDFWLEQIGEYSNDVEARIKIFNNYKNNIPKIIPIYSHRYVISDNNVEYPVISIHQTDVIYYGANLLEYFENEFNKTYNISKINKISFWSDIIEK